MDMKAPFAAIADGDTLADDSRSWHFSWRGEGP
jgi:hypothetical protein